MTRRQHVLFLLSCSTRRTSTGFFIGITYTIRITNNTIVIRKQFFWLTYRRVSSTFNEITLDEKGINFSKPSGILRLEAYEGDGYYWGDLPDCFLVSWEEKVVLGDKSDLQAFRSLLKDSCYQ